MRSATSADRAGPTWHRARSWWSVPALDPCLSCSAGRFRRTAGRNGSPTRSRTGSGLADKPSQRAGSRFCRCARCHYRSERLGTPGRRRRSVRRAGLSIVAPIRLGPARRNRQCLECCGPYRSAALPGMARVPGRRGTPERVPHHSG